MTTDQKPKRKPHRRGQARLSGPSGACRAQAAAQRQCCICRKSRAQSELLQLDLVPNEASVAGAPRHTGRHSYVCVARACFAAAALRVAGQKGPKGSEMAALEAFAVPLTLLATRRLIETIGLVRRQGLLVMGASRIVALRPNAADLFLEFEDDGYDEDDDDDDDDDDHDGHDTGEGGVDVDGTRHTVSIPIDAAVDGATRADVDVLSSLEPNGEQDVILLAIDAARRTARRLGPTALPSMLCGADMGRAAGGAPVAAVGIPAGRLALQAAYWLRVWYEARAVLTAPESMLN